MATKRRKGKQGYAKRLSSPKWQQKRLQIMERDQFRCSWCGNGEEELQIHHGYYAKSADGKQRAPDEYPDDTLWCLCDSCHERAEKARTAVYYELAKVHPRYHWDVRRLLVEVQEQIETDAASLKDRSVVRGETEK